MTRYVTRAAQWYPPLTQDGDITLMTGDRRSITVHETNSCIFTGLYDSTGQELYRVKDEIGFRIPCSLK